MDESEHLVAAHSHRCTLLFCNHVAWSSDIMLTTRVVRVWNFDGDLLREFDVPEEYDVPEEFDEPEQFDVPEPDSSSSASDNSSPTSDNSGANQSESSASAVQSEISASAVNTIREGIFVMITLNALLI